MIEFIRDQNGRDFCNEQFNEVMENVWGEFRAARNYDFELRLDFVAAWRMK